MPAVLPRLCAVAMMLAFTSAAWAAQLHLVDQLATANARAASQVTLGWNPSPDSSVLGYSICWGVSAGETTNRLEAGNVTNAMLGGLEANVTYYFCVIADAGNNRTSGPSNEIEYRLPEAAPAPNPPTLPIDLPVPGRPAGSAGVVSSSANPVLPGQTVTLTMELSAVAPGAGTPTGTVQFIIDGVNVGAPVTLSGGVASYETSILTVGTHTVVAEYTGDDNFTGTTNSLAPFLLVNTQPVAGTDTIQRDLTNSVKVAIATLLSNDTDANGDAIIFLGVSATSVNGGTVVSNSNWIFYTPAPGWTDTDTFTYTMSDGRGDPVIGTVTVNVRTNNGPSPNRIITHQGGGSYLVHGDGIPNRTYRVQYAEDVENPVWQTLGSATADANGVLEIIDSAGSPQRLYRSVYP